MRPWLLRGAAAVVVAVVVLTIVGSRGTYAIYPREEYSDPAKRVHAPDWVKVCADTPKLSWYRCGRITGRVVWIQRKDSDGDGDVHFAVVSRLHVRIVKFQRFRRLPKPGIGDSLTAVGPVFQGGSGHQELNAISVR